MTAPDELSRGKESLETGPLNAAWNETLEDMWAMADELDAEGWDTLSVAADHTGPEGPEHGETDRFGLVYVIPGNEAESFEATATGSFPRYDVFRQEVNGRVFVVTELLDPETETAILVAGNFWRHETDPLVAAVREAGEMYTHVQKLDGTQLGSFRHDEPAKFFPELDE
jgi:hypothetical protein